MKNHMINTNTPNNFCSMFKGSRNEILPAYDLTHACYHLKLINLYTPPSPPIAHSTLFCTDYQHTDLYP